MRRCGREKDNTVVIVRTGHSVAFMHDLTSPPANGIYDIALQAVITLTTHVKTKLRSHIFFIVTVALERKKKGQKRNEDCAIHVTMANDYSAKHRNLYDI
jgi:hypothetical protein